MHGFFEKLGIKEPVFIGASDGGMVAETIKSLRKKYFLAPLMLFYMKHCNYEKLKPKLIKVGMGHSRNESKEELAYAKDMFETIFKDYTKEKDVHISGLLADLMKQTPVTETDFRMLKGKILLILPDQDFFSGKMQKDLIQLMHDPVIQYVSGGHLSTILKADDYVKVIRDIDHFLATRCARKPFCFSIVSTVKPAFSAMAMNSAGLCIFTSPCPNRLARGISR